MLRWMLKAALSMLALAGFLYATFFVPLGEHTLYRHLARIAATEEARELGAGVSAAVDAARVQVASAAGNPAERADGAPANGRDPRSTDGERAKSPDESHVARRPD
jgi:hypothetical protein